MSEQTILDLALLVRRLCRRLPESDTVRIAALDYLRRKGLEGSILREMEERKHREATIKLRPLHQPQAAVVLNRFGATEAVNPSHSFDDTFLIPSSSEDPNLLAETISAALVGSGFRAEFIGTDGDDWVTFELFAFEESE